MTRESTVRWLNPGAVVRDMLNDRDVRRWERSGRFPPMLERTYRSAYEYQRDQGRLQANGYRVLAARSNRDDPSVAIDVAAPFYDEGFAYQVAAGRFGSRLRRSPLLYRVRYERALRTSPTANPDSAARRSAAGTLGRDDPT